MSQGENYIRIDQWMLQDLDLTLAEASIYSVVYYFQEKKNVKSVKLSRSFLGQKTKLSTRQISRVTASLKEKKLIFMIRKSGGICEFSINRLLLKTLDTPSISLPSIIQKNTSKTSSERYAL